MEVKAWPTGDLERNAIADPQAERGEPAVGLKEDSELLGFEPPCEDTILKYMAKPYGGPRKPSTTWLPFLRNHLEVSWAIDFFTVTTLRFRTIYVFVVLDHRRRKVRDFATTYSPSMNWTIQQLRNAMPWDVKPKYLLRDNDGVYGEGVRGFLDSCDVEEVRTAYRSPWQNPFVERLFGSLRQEMLDHVIVINQRHLERLLTEFVEKYYHCERPHQGLNGETPIPRQELPKFPGPTRLVSSPVLGGLHHRYKRVAA